MNNNSSKPLSAEDALYKLADYILDKDYYSTNISNAIIVENIKKEYDNLIRMTDYSITCIILIAILCIILIFY